MNPIMNMMANKMMGNNPQMQRLAEFKKFMNSMQGKDPQALIQEMLNNGKINQNQLEQAKQMANQFYSQFNN